MKKEKVIVSQTVSASSLFTTTCTVWRCTPQSTRTHVPNPPSTYFPFEVFFFFSPFLIHKGNDVIWLSRDISVKFVSIYIVSLFVHSPNFAFDCALSSPLIVLYLHLFTSLSLLFPAPSLKNSVTWSVISHPSFWIFWALRLVSGNFLDRLLDFLSLWVDISLIFIVYFLILNYMCVSVFSVCFLILCQKFKGALSFFSPNS